MNKRDMAKDEMVLAKIIAGGMSSKRKILDQVQRFKIKSTNGWGVTMVDDAQGPACAIGAGCLYAGIARTSTPLDTFASEYKVSYEYACGVSDGFESADGGPDPSGFMPSCSTGVNKYLLSKKEKNDYARGVAVGTAVNQYFGKSGRNGR